MTTAKLYRYLVDKMLYHAVLYISELEVLHFKREHCAGKNEIEIYYLGLHK
jgi:hypothetical protein